MPDSPDLDAKTAVRAKPPRRKKPVDLTDAYDRAANHMVPKAFFPIFAAFFVVLCGGMAFMLFMIGKIFGGLLFSSVVLVGLYVAWNKFQAWREERRLGAAPEESAPTIEDLWNEIPPLRRLSPGPGAFFLILLLMAVSGAEYFDNPVFYGLAILGGIGFIAWRVIPILRAKKTARK